MTVRLGRVAGAAVLGLLLAGPGVLHLRVGSEAFAQANQMAGIGHSQSISARATVKSIDQATRTVTLETPAGNTLVVKASDQVRNLAQVKPGDTVIAHYFQSTAYVLSPAGAKLPANSMVAAGARAAPGTLPGGALATRMTVTGLVVAVDTSTHTVSLVDPSGGAVRTIDVVTPAGQRALKMVKVGDNITAIITDAVLVAVEPAS
jgi:Cu/Ag efflux protein CusF